MISELYQKVLENELGRARYLLLLMIVGTWQILKQAKLEILAEALPIPRRYPEASALNAHSWLHWHTPITPSIYV